MNLRSIDLNLLVAFEALIEERHVTRAARRVGLSQPAMSNALSRLRRTLGDPLLVRTAEGMALTPAAEALASAVRAAFGPLREALEEKPRFDPRSSHRTFNLLMNDYVEIFLLAPLVSVLRARASGIGVRVHRWRNLFKPPPAVALAGSFDLAAGFFPDALGVDAALHTTLLWEEKNVCIARRDHPKIRGKMTLSQYAEAGHVAVFYKAQGPGLIDTLLSEKGYERRSTVVVPHFSSVPFMVACSDLIATVPEGLARRFAPWLRLQVLPVPFEMPPFRMSMLWHARFQADAAQVWFRELVSATASRLNKRK
jgi:DNA-binding transcriptional LysR family regulator